MADLDALTRIAQEATPGPWGISASEVWGIDQRGVDEKGTPWYGEEVVQMVCDEGDEVGEANATFIATFDPPTVLALLDVARAAEAKVKAEDRAYVDDADEYATPPWTEFTGQQLRAALAKLGEQA